MPHLLGQSVAAAHLQGACRAISRRSKRSNKVDADALTFETCSSGPGDLKAIGEIIKDKKIVIGVIDHHTLQVERPDEVAALIREALKHIPAERLIISSDCGMGREGMGRRHAAYKMVSMVLGTNIVRKELGLPEADAWRPKGVTRSQSRKPEGRTHAKARTDLCCSAGSRCG